MNLRINVLAHFRRRARRPARTARLLRPLTPRGARPAAPYPHPRQLSNRSLFAFAFSVTLCGGFSQLYRAASAFCAPQVRSLFTQRRHGGLRLARSCCSCCFFGRRQFCWRGFRRRANGMMRLDRRRCCSAFARGTSERASAWRSTSRSVVRLQRHPGFHMRALRAVVTRRVRSVAGTLAKQRRRTLGQIAMHTADRCFAQCPPPVPPSPCPSVSPPRQFQVCAFAAAHRRS